MLSEAAFNKFMNELKNAGKAVAAIERVRFGGFLFWKGNVESLRREVAKLNLLIRKGAARQADKLHVLNHEALIDEARVLRSALQSAVPLVEDVRTRKYLDVAVGWLKSFEDTVNKHRILLEKDVPLEQTDEYERIILIKYEQHKSRLLMAIDDIVGKENDLIRNAAPDLGRRKVLAYAAAGLVAAFTGTAYGQDAQQNAQGGVAKTAFTTKKALSEAEISTLMDPRKYATVDAILKDEQILPAKVEFVEYDPRTRTNNFDALVYQKHLKPEERKPVLVLFYHNKDPTNGSLDLFSARDAIALKKLAESFTPQIKFVAYESDVDPALAANKYAGVWRMGIPAIPSIAMYSTFDVLSGETLETNRGELKLIDVIRGGPDADKYVQGMVNNCSNYWIPTNLLMRQSIKRDGKVYRHNAQWRIQAVADAQLSLK